MKENQLPHTDGSNRLISDREENTQIQRVALYAFLINLGLVGIKVVLAYFSASLAVAANFRSFTGFREI